MNEVPKIGVSEDILHPASQVCTVPVSSQRVIAFMSDQTSSQKMCQIKRLNPVHLSVSRRRLCRFITFVSCEFQVALMHTTAVLSKALRAAQQVVQRAYIRVKVVQRGMKHDVVCYGRTS